jgi:hypothetical protein
MDEISLSFFALAFTSALDVSYDKIQLRWFE